MAVRAKFRCMSVTRQHTGFTGPAEARVPTEQVDVRLLPVIYRKSGDYASDENKSFWDATPAGELTMTITNPAAADYFRPGQAYFLDFTEADG